MTNAEVEKTVYAIETRGLSKRFGDCAAVKSLDLRIEEGTVYGLLGVNGAGKTTTIKMLTGLIRPTSGDALLAGHSILTENEAVRRVTGVSPQETALAMHLTVRENLELMAGLYGKSRTEAKAATAAMLERMSLLAFAEKQAKQLSGGWQRRLSIAMALIAEPAILFLDEPTLGLDVLARRELWQVIRALRGKTTVVLTTHYLEEAEALSDRIGIMAGGVLRAEGTVGELLAIAEKENFEDAFVAIADGEVKNV